MGDARTERWAEHRVEMRRTLIDAAIRVIETEGPQASMRAIAAEAKVSKPTLYRFFADKADLALAIADQAKQDIVRGLAEVRRQPAGSAGAMLHAALAGYAALIVDHPQIARFLFLDAESPGAKSLENWQAIRSEVADLVILIIESSGATTTVDASLYASMIVGAVEGAANWWSAPAEMPGSAEEFVAVAEPVVRAIIERAATAAGVTIDFDRPLTAAS
ncbi:TetR/AcrR family transcriptional regulator [Nocardia sp. NPDC059246]|uniref:TetR/AcrR family transcriptional regulator n=1 Tax=unclassified Nocardia TaxID=2637762 RepID=UPI00368CF483